MAETQNALLEDVLVEVGNRTATLAEKKKNPELVVEQRDRAKLVRFYDDGVLKVLERTAIVGNKSGAADPEHNAGEKVPPELRLALVFYVMGEWFGDCAEPDLSRFYHGKFEGEMAERRWTGFPQAKLPYRPHG